MLREFNLIACFMTKPFMGVSASGCHTNMSLWKGGKIKTSASTNNIIMAKGAAPIKISLNVIDGSSKADLITKTEMPSVSILSLATLLYATTTVISIIFALLFYSDPVLTIENIQMGFITAIIWSIFIMLPGFIVIFKVYTRRNCSKPNR